MAKAGKPATTLTQPEALIYAMVAMSAVDRVMSDVELGSIGNMVRRLPVFADFDPDKLTSVARACGKLAGEQDGLDRIIEAIATALPARLQETAYALAVEVAAADLTANLEELRFLEMLADRFDLDDMHVAGIKHSARLRYRTREDA